MKVAFDIISDLNLSESSEFDWTGQPTSLFCVIPGNISPDVPVVYKTLRHLSSIYHGVFYIDGAIENKDVYGRDQRNKDLQKIAGSFHNVVYLHNNVVVVDGVALIGINGWYNNYHENNIVDEFHTTSYRYEDIDYLEKTIEKLQLHNDVKRIMVISNSVPSKELYFGEFNHNEDELSPVNALYKDTEHKVTHWVYGTYGKIVDTTLNSVNYVSNGKFDRNPYYAKRIEITL
jgi:hypothetical protein